MAKDGVEIIAPKAKERQGKRTYSAIHLLFLMAGAFGLLLFLGSLNAVTYRGWLVFPFTGALCWGIWLSYLHRRKVFVALLLATIGAVALLTLLYWDTLLVQMAQIRDSLAGEQGLETMEITGFALLFAAVISWVLFLLEFVVKNHGILYLLTTALLLLAPLMGIQMGIGAVALLIVFQIAFWAIQIASMGRGKLTFGVKNRKGLTKKIGVAISLLLVGAFLIALPLTALFSNAFYGVVDQAEGFAYRSFTNLSGQSSDPITGGQISSGNNYHTGTAHLELETLELPTEPLYLRGFGGGEYVGGDWIRSSDEELFDDMAENLNWQEWEDWIGNMYYSMYYTMNQDMGEADESASRMLTIQHSNGSYDNLYVPYYSRQRWPGRYRDSRREGYVYQYYEQKDVQIDWEDVAWQFQQERDWYTAIQQAYLEEAQDAYTQVPTELLPRLTQLVRENPLEDLDEITGFILYTLHSNATYTLTPGRAPLNEDIVEYFLFESKQGYCVHFAATATLMYRLYGVPARYATGYMVSPEAFTLQENGTYHATVTDESAHAWVEIFLEGYGWTPVEVTPTAEGTTAASYPGFSSEDFDQILQIHSWNLSVPSLEEEPEADNPSAQPAEGWTTSFSLEIHLKEYQDVLYLLAVCLGYCLLLLPFFLDYRRMSRLRKMEGMNCRQVFAQLMELLHFGGLLLDVDGTEEDFLSRFHQAAPWVSRQEAARLQYIVSKAAYGDQKPTSKEEAFVAGLYHRTARELYDGLPKGKKLTFRYWRVFG